ncbi:hypothetical protein CCUS01_12854, partial [Colletotrichum cuscutae]
HDFGHVENIGLQSHPVFDSCHPIRAKASIPDRYGGLTEHRPHFLLSADMNSIEWTFRGLNRHHPSYGTNKNKNSVMRHPLLVFFQNRCSRFHKAAIRREGGQRPPSIWIQDGQVHGPWVKSGARHDVGMEATAEPRTAALCLSMQGTRSQASACGPALLLTRRQTGLVARWREPSAGCCSWMMDHGCGCLIILPECDARYPELSETPSQQMPAARRLPHA